MIPLLLASIITCLSIGFISVLIFWPDSKPLKTYFLIKISLAIGLGFGISSSIFFLWLLFIDTSIINFIIIEMTLIIGLFLLLLYIKKKKQYSYPEMYIEESSKSKISRILSISFYIMLISNIVTFVLLSLKNPHGGWDAWAIWNMRARFLFRGGKQWTDAFSTLLFWSNIDYPLLMPGLIARCWKYIGNNLVIVPSIISLFFIFANIGLIVSSLSLLRSKSQGFLAGIILLGTPFFIKCGAFQYADVPTGFFFLATIVLFFLINKISNYFGLLLLAGMMAGFAGWTKNEGLLFLISIIIIRFVFVFPIKGFKSYIKEMIPFAFGLMPILLIIIYFKTQLAPPIEVLYSQHGFQPTVEKLLDFSRYIYILKIFGIELLNFGKGLIGIIPLLVLYLFLLGTDIKEEYKIDTKISAIVSFVLLAIYFIIYLFTSHNLYWHIGTSLNRLILQLWPSFIFIYFMIVRTPEEIIRERSRA